MKKIVYLFLLIPFTVQAGMFENDEGELHWWMIPLMIVIGFIVVFINGRAGTRKDMLTLIGFDPKDEAVAKWAKRDELHDAKKIIAEAERRLKEDYPSQTFRHQYEKVEFLIHLASSYSSDYHWHSSEKRKARELALKILRDRCERLRRENR